MDVAPPAIRPKVAEIVLCHGADVAAEVALYLATAVDERHVRVNVRLAPLTSQRSARTKVHNLHDGMLRLDGKPGDAVRNGQDVKCSTHRDPAVRVRGD
jgi:hypothetical protein